MERSWEVNICDGRARGNGQQADNTDDESLADLALNRIQNGLTQPPSARNIESLSKHMSPELRICVLSLACEAWYLKSVPAVRLISCASAPRFPTVLSTFPAAVDDVGQRP